MHSRAKRLVSGLVMVLGLLSSGPAWAADTTRPTVGTASPDNATVGVPVQISAPVSDSESGIASCRLYVDNLDVSPMDLVFGLAETSYTFFEAGVHTIFVFCRDNVNNFNSGFSSSMLVAAAPGFGGGGSVPPTVGQILPLVATVDTPVMFTASVVGATSCSLFANSFGLGAMTLVGGVASFEQTFATAGSYLVYAQCVNSVGNSSSGPEATVVVSEHVAATPLFTPALIKTACPVGAASDHPCKAVYYRGANGKRHAFPNSRVFFSWYPDFLTVKEVSTTEMAAAPLGFQVTYRPGVKLVKFTTLNNVYAVGKGGVLRWIKSEAVASALYGVDWNKKVDDISDVFFLDYKFGADVNVASDFSPAGEMAGSMTIE